MGPRVTVAGLNCDFCWRKENVNKDKEASGVDNGTVQAALHNGTIIISGLLFSCSTGLL